MASDFLINGEFIGLKEYFNDLDKIGMFAKAEVRKEFKKIANEVRNTIIIGMNSTPRDSGNFVTRRSVTHFRSFPGGYPAIDTGRGVGSISIDDRGDEVEVGSADAEYLKILEETENPKLKRPWLLPSYENIDIAARVQEAIRRAAQ
ncbi:MAG: hypothetical protein M0R00_07230 [Candidatus Omnitrophica bacterium]|nr:hypothetical protein [Candidatus Omnitrophota bacterium]